MNDHVDIWQFRTASGHTADTDLIGFHVEAADGPIGKVHKLSEDVGAQYLVVDTGPWIFGKHVLLPARTVTRIEIGERKVYLDRTKDEIKNSPDYDEHTHHTEPSYRDRYTLYYEPYYGGRII
ncbi:PRC-barrel domain-containing protein [Kitasatospora sp. A2-31]|uniref:PRC-barrel domain-containing protein n=1 Tax=Kitasatospora sp. A2-31 TaxID=2916414 RepID=UPI001EEB4792|nr:PRC-barrel domain-containing protein [Kitasatospora sp. A2-31]MCG6494394.1 PRC-barrel domain-containing protein [Kitasatospora sp. A2-31]